MNNKGVPITKNGLEPSSKMLMTKPNLYRMGNDALSRTSSVISMQTPTNAMNSLNNSMSLCNFFPNSHQAIRGNLTLPPSHTGTQNYLAHYQNQNQSQLGNSISQVALSSKNQGNGSNKMMTKYKMNGLNSDDINPMMMMNQNQNAGSVNGAAAAQPLNPYQFNMNTIANANASAANNNYPNNFIKNSAQQLNITPNHKRPSCNGLSVVGKPVKPIGIKRLKQQEQEKLYFNGILTRPNDNNKQQQLNGQNNGILNKFDPNSQIVDYNNLNNLNQSFLTPRIVGCTYVGSKILG